jgi:carbon-monoxide dehydrogenase medium subunit
LTLDGDKCAAARIGLTNVSAVPMRAKNAEQALIGKNLTDDVIEAAGAAASAECDPSPDLRGSVEYKRDITRVLTKRAIRTAIERAR